MGADVALRKGSCQFVEGPTSPANGLHIVLEQIAENMLQDCIRCDKDLETGYLKW